MKKNSVKYFVDNDSLFSYGTVIFFLLSCVFCLLGSLGSWNDRFFIVSQVILPIVCSLVFVIFMRVFGRRLFWLTSLPAILGLAFFVIRALSYGSVLYSAISIVLSVLSVFLYTAVVFGWIKQKWPLIPVFILGLAFHVFVKDLNTLRNPEIAVSFSGIMQEISVLFMILAMVFVSFAMRNKRGIESLGLPKIRSPKVIVQNAPEKTEATAVPEIGAEESQENTLPSQEEAVKLNRTEPKEIPEATAPTLEAAAQEEVNKSENSEETEKETAETEPDTGADQ